MENTYHPEKGPYLHELRPGEHFIGFYTLRSKQLETFRDASRGVYLTLVLSDRSGQMIARVWENAEDMDRQVLQGEVVKVEGDVEEFREQIQAIVLRMRSANPDEFDHRDLVQSSTRDHDQMISQLNAYMDQISNPDLRALVDFIFSQPGLIDRFSQAPAARRIHHAYLGGLLEHTLEVLAVAGTVIQLYPSIDPDLLLTGVLLHDIGKIREYRWDIDLDYSDEGRLLGHIVMGDELVRDALANFPDFPAELGLRLRHMLIAHHDRLEWGSPKRPVTVEAIALHHIENLSAQINRFQSLLEERPTGEAWTTYDRLLGRQLYGGATE